MRVIVVNKFWYSRGGQERVAMDEARWLAEDGHHVAHFSAAHPLNAPSDWSPYFPPYIELGRGNRPSPTDQLLAVGRLFHNVPARRAFERLVDDFRPDLVHIHGIARQLSPSLLGVARSRGIPVVQTLHDYHHICPSGDLLRAGSHLCDPCRCSNGYAGSAILNRCAQDSRLVSALLGAETVVARVRKIYERAVVRYISPSRFMADVMRRAEWTNRPIDIIENATDDRSAPGPRQDAGESFVYTGRLSREKGVGTLVEASLKADVRLGLAGDGPLRASLMEAAGPNVTFHGLLGAREVGELLSSARAAVLPSEWFENMPMAAIEALAAGVPVIASNTGGIPEIVRDGIDGILFEPGDVKGLAGAMQRLRDDPTLALKMGANARDRARQLFGRQAHMERLLQTYSLAMEAR